jgi:hypothetical protein
MCFDHDEYADVYRESNPVARKRYVCQECRLPILPGERYQRVFSVFEGRAMTSHTCAVCQWFMERIADYERSRGCEGSEAYPPFMELETALDSNEYSERGYGRLLGMVPLQRIGVGQDGVVKWSDYCLELEEKETT